MEAIRRKFNEIVIHLKIMSVSAVKFSKDLTAHLNSHVKAYYENNSIVIVILMDRVLS